MLFRSRWCGSASSTGQRGVELRLEPTAAARSAPAAAPPRRSSTPRCPVEDAEPHHRVHHRCARAKPGLSSAAPALLHPAVQPCHHRACRCLIAEAKCAATMHSSPHTFSERVGPPPCLTPEPHQATSSPPRRLPPASPTAPALYSMIAAPSQHSRLHVADVAACCGR